MTVSVKWGSLWQDKRRSKAVWGSNSNSNSNINNQAAGHAVSVHTHRPTRTSLPRQQTPRRSPDSPAVHTALAPPWPPPSAVCTSASLTAATREERHTL